MGNVLENEQTRILNKSSKTNENLQINEEIFSDWKPLLDQWIQIYDELSKYNSISTTFLLHISSLLSQQ
jgi:hypothetical protein